MSRNKAAVSPEKEFIAALKRFDGGRSLTENFRVALEALYLSLRTSFPHNGRDHQIILERHQDFRSRYRAHDLSQLEDLWRIIALAMAQGGQDFLGKVAAEIGVLDRSLGQHFTPYQISRLMAAMTVGDSRNALADKGYLTVCEPASGSGAMIIAVADHMQDQGIDIGKELLVQATDLSPIAFWMTYLQLAARGIPANVRRGNSLTLEIFETAWTPASFVFLNHHRMAGDPDLGNQVAAE